MKMRVMRMYTVQVVACCHSQLPAAGRPTCPEVEIPGTWVRTLELTASRCAFESSWMLTM